MLCNAVIPGNQLADWESEPKPVGFLHHRRFPAKKLSIYVLIPLRGLVLGVSLLDDAHFKFLGGDLQLDRIGLRPSSSAGRGCDYDQVQV